MAPWEIPSLLQCIDEAHRLQAENEQLHGLLWFVSTPPIALALVLTIVLVFLLCVVLILRGRRRRRELRAIEIWNRFYGTKAKES